MTHLATIVEIDSKLKTNKKTAVEALGISMAGNRCVCPGTAPTATHDNTKPQRVKTRRRVSPVLLLSLAIWSLCLSPAIAFQSKQRAIRNSDDAPTIFRVEAYAGQPFGVGMMKYRMCAGDEMIDQSGATRITEKNNRVFYPVFTRPAVNRFLQKITGNPVGQPDSMHNLWFLFRGEKPLELVLEGACTASVTVEVEYAREKKFSRIYGQWWREFVVEAQRQNEWGDYPPLIETYLRTMLSNRLGLSLPAERQRSKDQLMETLELIFDVESLRSETIEETLLGRADHSAANQPLPSDVFWNYADLDPSDFLHVELEPFANCVPEECYYLRFGNWNNQIWLRRLTDEFGGDLSHMVNLRGYQARIPSKFLDQLAIQSTEFDRLFGGNLIADVAVIGNDMFFQDGASVGVLLNAKNTQALTNNLTTKRKKFADDHGADGCRIDDVDLNGVKVQFLRTPDNRYRSFYVVRGDNHLVTSSMSLAKRFIEASAGTRALADSLEFRYARQQMPLSRDDTVFIFVPAQLLYTLLGPHYQIELARRNRSVADMQITELASLAASNEGVDSSNMASLVANGFLPANFGLRPDGSQLTWKDNYWTDSIRGRRGFFVPITDVQISGVSAREIEWYRQRRIFFTENLSQLDPMFVALKRYSHENNVERIVYDARVAPFGQEKYEWLFSMLGPPISEQIKGTPNDIVSFQASLDGGAVSRRIGEHQVFGAIQNEFESSREIKPNSLFRTLELFRNVPGYVGSWPKAGYLDWLPRLGGQPDSGGFTYSKMFGLWRAQWDEFAAVSFDRERLEDLKQHADVVISDRPAQVRVRVGDLAHSNLRDWANSQNYRRSWETSIANTRLLNMMSQQFNLVPELAKSTVENLLDVNLVCSLGGEYQLKNAAGRNVWYSTAWPDFSNPMLPDAYVSPLLKWFRGFELELAKSREQFSVHGFLDIERSGSSSLPSFNLFKGFSVFGNQQPSESNNENRE